MLASPLQRGPRPAEVCPPSDLSGPSCWPGRRKAKGEAVRRLAGAEWRALSGRQSDCPTRRSKASLSHLRGNAGGGGRRWRGWGCWLRSRRLRGELFLQQPGKLGQGQQAHPDQFHSKAPVSLPLLGERELQFVLCDELVLADKEFSEERPFPLTL